MREQSRRLKEIAKMARLYGNVDARSAVQESLVCYRDAAFVRSDKASDAIEKSGFTGAGRAEEDSYSRRNGKVHIKAKRATREASADAQLGWI